MSGSDAAAPLEVTITSLSSEGDGVAREPGGRVVFVPFTAPGDRVRIRAVSSKRRFLRGSVEQLLAPGPARVDPVCPVYGSCGGCAWQHLAYPAQLEAKALQLRDAFERIAHLSAPEIEMTPSPAPYGYRSRARVLREAGQVGYRRRRSRDLCAISRCPVLDAPTEALLDELRGDASAPDGEWELASGAGVARRMRVGDPGAGPIEIAVAGDRLRISPGVFFQAHAGLHDALADAVLGAAGRGGLALDLYAGAGFFTLGLARRFERVLAVESSPPAVDDCRHNLRQAGLANARVISGRLERCLRAAPLSSLRPEVVVLDPPRTGLPGPATAWLAARGADRIVYLSCDPATLARDVAGLGATGYRLTRLQAFDLFPQTPHVEALAVLESAAAG